MSAVLSADFNGDGFEDHAALYWYEGPSGQPAPIEYPSFFVAWLGKSHGDFWKTGPHPIGEVGHWFPDRLEFHEGIVVVSGAQWGPEDQPCCPTREESSEYEFHPGPRFGFRVGRKLLGQR